MWEAHTTNGSVADACIVSGYRMSRSPTSHNRHRSDTLASSALSRHDPEYGRSPRRRSALDSLNPNAVANAQNRLGEKGTVSPSLSAKSASSRNSLSVTPRSHRRPSSAPITPESLRKLETGVLISRTSKRQTFTVDAFSASLISNLVPGLKVGADSIDRRNSLGPPIANDETMSTRTESQYSSTSKRRRPNLSLSIASRDSAFARCDVAKADQQHEPMRDGAIAAASQTSHGGKEGTSTQQHLRRRSWKSTTRPSVEDEQASHRTDRVYNGATRPSRRPLTPAVEVSLEEDMPMFPESAAPRPSLEDEDEDQEGDAAFALEDSRLEVSLLS